MKIISCVTLCFLSINICWAEEEIVLSEKVKKAYELYLQDQSVTLESNQWRLGIDASYTSDEKNILLNHTESQTIHGGLSINYGITDKLEIFARVPVVYSNTSVQEINDIVEEGESSTNLANILIGSNFTLLKIKEGPDVTLQINFSLPTSTENSLDNESTFTGGLTLHQDFDPVFLYGGIHGSKTLNGNFNDSFSYQTGFGFYLDQHFAIGAELTGGYKFTPQILPSNESLLLTSRAAFVINKKHIVQPSVSFGLDKNSPNYTVGIEWTREF